MEKKKPRGYYQKTESLLYRYPFIRLGCESIIDEMNDILEETGLGSIDPCKEVFKTNKINSIVENAFINKLESKRLVELEKNLDKNNSIITKIDKVLNELTEEERQVINLYYFKSKQWKEISEMLNYSVPWCWKIKKKSLEKIALGLAYKVLSNKDLQ